MFQFYSSANSSGPRRAVGSHNQTTEPRDAAEAREEHNSWSFHYSSTQLDILLKRFDDLEKTSNRLLDQAKTQNLCSIVFQILMISLGLTTSYIAAVSGIPADIKNIATASLGFLNAVLSGVFAMMKFTSNATLIYNAQREIKECLPTLECAILNQAGDRPYEQLITLLDRLRAKYEMFEQPLAQTTHPESIHSRLSNAAASSKIASERKESVESLETELALLSTTVNTISQKQDSCMNYYSEQYRLTQIVLEEFHGDLQEIKTRLDPRSPRPSGAPTDAPIIAPIDVASVEGVDLETTKPTYSDLRIDLEIDSSA